MVADVASWPLVWIDPAGWDDFGGVVGSELDLPSVCGGVVAGFHDPVVMGADQYQVVQVGRSALPPGDDVVGVAVLGWLVAPRERAPCVSDFEGLALGGCDEPLRLADVEDLGGSAEDDRE